LSTLTPKRHYRHDIDGLRAVAVLSVLFFHLDLGFSGGYVGVDVFFVISGYLITGLILKAQSENRFNLKQFWGRRIRRLVPAVTTMLLVVLVLGYAYLLPTDLDNLGEAAIAQILLVANVYFAGSFDYFAGPAELRPLLHTWSLAVEEQFYLLFPLLLVLCRRFTKRKLAITFGLLALASFVLSVWCLDKYPTAAFFILPTRAWELLLGALLVLVPAGVPSGNHKTTRYRFQNELISTLAAVALVITFFWYDKSTPFPGPAALLPCIATALLIYFNVHHQSHIASADTNINSVRGNTAIGNLLSLNPLTYIGRISYSLYLWHWPIIVFLKYENGLQLSTQLTVIALGASFLAAALSYHWIEAPFRHGHIFKTQRRFIIGTSFASLSLLGASIIYSEAGGLADRWETDVQLLLKTTDHRISKKYSARSREAAQADNLPILGVKASAEQPSTFLLWGDSHAASIAETCNRLAREYGVSGYVASQANTIPILGVHRPRHFESIAWNNDVLEFVQRHQIKHVLLASRWAGNIEVHTSGLTSFLITDDSQAPRTPATAQRALHRNLATTVAKLEQLGVQVWVLQQVPLQTRDPIHTLVTAIKTRATEVPRGVALSEHQDRQKNVNRILSSIHSDNYHLLDPTDYFYNGLEHANIGSIGELNVSYYRDIHHVTLAGSESILRPLLDTMFQAMVSPNSPVNIAIEPASNVR
jgi:peptidoglycan/LPS O-acetylase OafA/YrhL